MFDGHRACAFACSMAAVHRDLIGGGLVVHGQEEPIRQVRPTCGLVGEARLLLDVVRDDQQGTPPHDPASSDGVSNAGRRPNDGVPPGWHKPLPW